MRKFIFNFLSIFAISLANSFSQAPVCTWAHSVGGASIDRALGVANDHQGNVYVAGDFWSSSIAFDSITITNASPGMPDIFLARYDSSGNLVWAQGFGGADVDVCWGVAVDLQGNVIIVGQFVSSSLTFGSSTLTCAGQTDIFIVKLSSTGNVLWAKSVGAASSEWAPDVTTDLQNNIYVTGHYYSATLDFGSAVLTNSGGYDSYIAKYDSNGNCDWAIGFGSDDDDEAQGLTVDVSGNLWVTGGFESDSIAFGPTTIYNSGSNVPDIFVAKYDSTGSFLWAESVGGTSDDRSTDITSDSSGSVYVTGLFQSIYLYFASTLLPNAGIWDVFILKYDSSGGQVWAKGAGGADFDYGLRIAVDEASNVYLTGIFGSPTISFDSIAISNSGAGDVFITKTDSAGNTLWAKDIGGSDVELQSCLSLVSDNTIYIAGQSNSDTLKIDTINLINSGQGDIFIAKLGIEGTTGYYNEVFTESLNIYPNPVIENLFISGLQLKGESQTFISFYDMLGKKIYEGEFTFHIDVSSLPEGIYFIKLQNAKGVRGARFVKEGF